MSFKPTNQSANLAMLQLVAHRLGDLNEKVVYLGGCVTALFVTDSTMIDVRATVDVDCIVDIASLIQYYELEKSLAEKGFKRSLNESVICRWFYDDIILDIMPADRSILGFGNQWYQEACKTTVLCQLTEALEIKVPLSPYFLATKLEAFKDRGKGDFYASHDLEDIITVIYGRKEIVDEILLTTLSLRSYLKETFENLLKEEAFLLALPGHLNDGPDVVVMRRAEIVVERIKAIIKKCG